MKYTIELVLSSFLGTEIMEVERHGRNIKGIFIPFEENGVYQGNYAKVKVYLEALDRKPNNWGQSHLLKHCFSKKKFTLLKELGYDTKQLPILGFLKPKEDNKYNYYLQNKSGKSVAELIKEE